jgi:hypothetical protein
LQILGPWGSPPTSGNSFCDYHGGATHITGFTIKYSTTHKAIWGLTVNYVVRGQPFQDAHGSQSGNPEACETEVKFPHITFQCQYSSNMGVQWLILDHKIIW